MHNHSVSTLAVIVLSLATAATAQTRGSYDPFGDRPQTAPPQSMDYAIEYVTDYPATEVRAVPPARARKVQGRLEFERARSALYTTLNWLREDFEYSDDYLDAQNQEQQAHDQYVEARRRVLRDLYESNPDYRALIDLRDDLAEQLENLKGQRGVDKQHVVATASLKLSYAMQARALEEHALSDDSQLQEARQRLREAGSTTATMRQRFDRAVRRDEEFLAARKTMEDSRIAYITADAFLDSAIRARNIALDYAYELRRYDKYKYLTTYTPYYISHPRYSYGDYGYIYRY